MVMGTKASLYLWELRKKYGDVFKVREHLENFYGKDLGDDIEKYVIDYYETRDGAYYLSKHRGS